MKTEDIIPNDSDNLEKYAPALAKLGRINPFRVPEGYFDELPGLIKSQAVLSSLPRDPGFTIPQDYFGALPEMIADQLEVSRKSTATEIPEGYFSTLPGIIRSRITLEGIKKENPFTVPENYFEELNGNILSHVKLQDAITENTFTVPDNYFEELPAAILSKIKLEEATGPNSHREESFSTPAGYFEEFPQRVLERIKVGENKEVKVISLPAGNHLQGGIFRKQYAYMAAAASIALLLGFWYFMKPAETRVTDSHVKELAAVEKTLVIENADAYGIDESMITDIASETNTDVQSLGDKLELDADQQKGLEIMLDNSIDMDIDESGF